MKRCLIALMLLFSLLLAGCGQLFEADYVVEATYAPVLSASTAERGDTTVRTLEELIDVLRTMVAEGESARRIAFDPAYAGDVSRDMANACWQVRTQDALCAYCVENISYDLSKIVSYFEAAVSVTYNETAVSIDSVVPLPYAADAGELLRQTIETGQPLLVLLCEHSSYTAEGMEAFIRQVYRESPAIAPCEPQIRVDMISGAEGQRLYEIVFDYGLPAGELNARRDALRELRIFEDEDLSALSEGERALLACELLAVACAYDEAAEGSVYAALVEGRADSLGFAFAYSELCRRLELNCRIVDGQLNREEHSWNLVEVDGEFYHVDASVCSVSGLQAGFLLNDATAWGPYRWDYFDYPHCVGTLSYEALLHAGEAGESADAEETTRAVPDSEATAAPAEDAAEEPTPLPSPDEEEKAADAEN